MAKQEKIEESSTPVKKEEARKMTEHVLRNDYPPKKKGEKVLLTEEGKQVLKSKNLI